MPFSLLRTHTGTEEERGGEKVKRSVSSSLCSGDGGGGGEGNYGTGDDVRYVRA